MSGKNSYDTALYLRISRDDADVGGGRKKESSSISSQRELLRAYVKNHEDLRIFDSYTDDGYSGTNFERPEFQRMMADIRAGKINCVLVKDLSRFGRDYIEAGKLIQKVFPAFHVRFIAVTDGFDSLYADRTQSSLILPVKNFINDSYCRDISVKVRAQQGAKRMEGKCISAFSAYGYRKDPEDKNSLLVDEYAADVVRKIFAWRAAGMSLGAIAKKLNNMGILSPLEYKKLLGMKYDTGFRGGAAAKWAAVSVKRILVNPVYTGSMVQGKQEKVNYKIKRRILKPKEEWICVKNTHEAIISEMQFEIVQDLLWYGGRRSEGKETGSLFGGVLLCADCGAPMIKRIGRCQGRRKVFYICQTKNKSMGCSRHSVEEDTLKRLVLREISTYMGGMESRREAAAYLGQLRVSDRQEAFYEAHIGQLKEAYDKYDALKNSLPADVLEGLVNEREQKEFYDFYEEKCLELQRSMEAQKQFVRDMQKNRAAARLRLEAMREAMIFLELDRELLVTAVRRILVHEGKELEIEFRFGAEGIGCENGKV